VCWSNKSACSIPNCEHVDSRQDWALEPCCDWQKERTSPLTELHRRQQNLLPWVSFRNRNSELCLGRDEVWNFSEGNNACVQGQYILNLGPALCHCKYQWLMCEFKSWPASWAALSSRSNATFVPISRLARLRVLHAKYITNKPTSSAEHSPSQVHSHSGGQ
jgi:hypothetical protein